MLILLVRMEALSKQVNLPLQNLGKAVLLQS